MRHAAEVWDIYAYNYTKTLSGWRVENRMMERKSVQIVVTEITGSR